MTDPFTLITMICWLSGPPNLDQGYCDVMNADHLKTKNYLECTFRAREFVRENEDQLKREFIDFKYAILNPKNLIGVDDYNQAFFDQIDENQKKMVVKKL